MNLFSYYPLRFVADRNFLSILLRSRIEVDMDMSGFKVGARVAGIGAREGISVNGSEVGFTGAEVGVTGVEIVGSEVPGTGVGTKVSFIGKTVGNFV